MSASITVTNPSSGWVTMTDLKDINATVTNYKKFLVNWRINNNGSTCISTTPPHASSTATCWTSNPNTSDLESAFFEGSATAFEADLINLWADRIYKLPDGSQIIIDKDGNYKIEDKDA